MPNVLVSLTEVALFAVGIFVNFRPSPVFVSMGLILESRRQTFGSAYLQKLSDFHFRRI